MGGGDWCGQHHAAWRRDLGGGALDVEHVRTGSTSDRDHGIEIHVEIFVDLEQFIEEVIGKDRIQTKQLDMYKGTVKKWQVLDDAAFSREEVTKMQAAVRAPLPEELEMYKERHSKPMTLPPTNENVSKWRDAESVTETGADFDPQFLEYDRERRKKFFMERYEKPKELAE